jgi:diacylglycerol kinase family enzyme
VKALFVVNPSSGRGQGEEVAETFERALSDAGIGVEYTPLDATVEQAIARADANALVIFGGDGTVHGLAPAAAAAELPLYHVPLGTENLFAREFGMDRRPETMLNAFQGHHVVEVDFARCNGLPFLIMCSVGPDAAVIHRLAAERTGSINRLSYTPHVLREALAPSIPTLTVEVDGEPVIDKRRGLLLVANSRQYALRMDPAHRASMTDGLLDILFLPCNSTARLIWWGARALVRSLGLTAGAVHARGERVLVTSEERCPAQLDGEAPGVREGDVQHPSAWTPLRIDIVPHALPVLTPTR